jgi:hypothetical protein
MSLVELKRVTEKKNGRPVGERGDGRVGGRA